MGIRRVKYGYVMGTSTSYSESIRFASSRYKRKQIKIMRNTGFLLIICFMVMLLLFSSCADVEYIDRCVITSPYGFWGGLWHGIIAPFGFIGSLLDDDIAMYAVNNSGGWYDFGFCLGAGILFGGTSKATN